MEVLTVFYPVWPDLFEGSSLQNVLVLGVLSGAMFQNQSQFHPVLYLSAVARVSVINVTHESDKFPAFRSGLRRTERSSPS